MIIFTFENISEWCEMKVEYFDFSISIFFDSNPAPRKIQKSIANSEKLMMHIALIFFVFL